MILPEGITSIGDDAFYNCSSLSDLNIPNGVTSIGHRAFCNCESLIEVVIPDGVTKILNSMFSGCSNLANVTIPASVTSIRAYAFAGCKSLTNLTLPNKLKSIEMRSFDSCTSLVSITIPDGVSVIDGWAFNGCSGLKEVTIPDSVTEIKVAAFYGSASLEDVYYAGSQTEWQNIKFGEDVGLSKVAIHFGVVDPSPTTTPTPTPTPTSHTHAWDSGVVTTPAKPGKEGVMTYTCTVCKETRTETIPALPVIYTVSYDANGGTGAPAAQSKTHGTALTLSSTKPTRTGYTFLGWAASKTATSAQYQPGGSYTANAAVTLYAVWKENAPTYATTLTVSSATASQGKEVSLNVSLAGNPGIIGINFQITYDKTRLKLIGYTDGAMKDWSVGIGESEKAIWIDEAADVINGNILTLKFQVLDNAPDGLAEVTVTGFKAAALDESAVKANIVAGGVTVTSRIPGDVNDDGEVDIFDCVRLKKYLAGFNVTINASNADVNGDGEVDIFDCVRLKKYLAGMSVELK